MLLHLVSVVPIGSLHCHYQSVQPLAARCAHASVLCAATARHVVPIGDSNRQGAAQRSSPRGCSTQDVSSREHSNKGYRPGLNKSSEDVGRKESSNNNNRKPNATLRGQRRSGNPLQDRISQTLSLQQLVSILEMQGHQLNGYSLAAAMSQLPKLHAAATGPKGMRPRHFVSEGKVHEAMSMPPSKSTATQETKQVLRMLAKPTSVWLPTMIFRCLGNSLWALAKLAEVPELRAPCRLLATMVATEIRIRGPEHMEDEGRMLARRTEAEAHYQQILHKVSRELGGLINVSGGKEFVNKSDVKSTGLKSRVLLDKPVASSNLMYSLALLGTDPQKEAQMLSWCCKSFVSQLPLANSQDLSNMAYAMSLLGMQDYEAWEHIAGEISRRIAEGQGSQFSAQALTNISWAILKLGRGHKDLAHNMSLYLVEAAANMSTHGEVSNLARAAVSAGVPKDSPFYITLTAKSLQLLPTMDLMHMANLLWSYSSSEVFDVKLLTAAKESLLSKPVWKLQRQPMALANILWSFAKLEYFDHQLFQVCMPEVKACANAMSSTERLMAFWAFSRYHDQMAKFERNATSQLGYRLLVDQELAAMLLDYLRLEVSTFNAQEVGTLASSVCMLGWFDKPLLDDLYARALHWSSQLTIPQMSSIIWCLFKMNQPCPQLAKAMVQQTQDIMSSRPPEAMEGDIAFVLWGAVLMGIGTPEFVEQVLQVLAAKLGHFQRSYLGLIAQSILHIHTFGQWTPEQRAWLNEPAPQLARLLESSMAYYTSKAEDTKMSYTQNLVKGELAQVVGVTDLKNEALTEDGMFSIDILAKYKGRSVAIEVDGPFHYMVNRPGIVTGDTLWRRKHLAAKGYTVLPVRATEYMDISSKEARMSHLQTLLDAAIEDPSFLQDREIQLGNAMTVFDQQPRLGTRRGSGAVGTKEDEQGEEGKEGKSVQEQSPRNQVLIQRSERKAWKQDEQSLEQQPLQQLPQQVEETPQQHEESQHHPNLPSRQRQRGQPPQFRQQQQQQLNREYARQTGRQSVRDQHSSWEDRRQPWQQHPAGEEREQQPKQEQRKVSWGLERWPNQQREESQAGRHQQSRKDNYRQPRQEERSNSRQKGRQPRGNVRSRQQQPYSEGGGHSRQESGMEGSLRLDKQPSRQGASQAPSSQVQMLLSATVLPPRIGMDGKPIASKWKPMTTRAYIAAITR